MKFGIPTRTKVPRRIKQKLTLVQFRKISIQSAVTLALFIDLFHLRYEGSKMGRVYKISGRKRNALAKLATRRNKNFEREISMPFDVWDKYVCKPLVKIMNLTEKRKSQLTPRTRVYRFCRRLRGQDTPSAICIFGQSEATLSRDCHKLAELFTVHFSDKWIRMPDINSREYECLRGQGSHSTYPNVPYSADITEIRIDRPANDHQSQFWCSNKRKHSMSYMVFVDGLGICRKIIGGVCGSAHDATLFRASKMIRAMSTYLRRADRILYDGIMPEEYGLWFHIPYCRKRRLGTLAQQAETKRQRTARSVVENYFSRLKVVYPIMDRFKFKRVNLDAWMRTACCFINIKLIFCGELRKFECSNANCWLCLNKTTLDTL